MVPIRCVFKTSVKRIKIKFWTISRFYPETIRLFAFNFNAWSWLRPHPRHLPRDRNLELVIQLLIRKIWRIDVSTQEFVINLQLRDLWLKKTIVSHRNWTLHPSVRCFLAGRLFGIGASVVSASQFRPLLVVLPVLLPEFLVIS